MKRIFLSCLLIFCIACVIEAQVIQDSVRIRLETSLGAEIGIDGDISSTNILSKKVAVGKHVVTVRFGTTFTKNYDLYVEQTGEHTYKYNISGKLNLNTTPSESTVYIDGISRGKTPLVLDILGGHNIRIENDPLTYYEVAERISLNPFETLNKDYVLLKRPPRLYGMVMATWSTSGIGGFMGICRRFGWYARFAASTNGVGIGLLSQDFNIFSGDRSGSGYYKKSGKHFYLAGTTGLMARFHKAVYGYIGAGYAGYTMEYVLDEDYMQPSYADNVIYPYGSRGAALDWGAIVKWKALIISCGYTTVLGKSYPKGNRHNEVYLGVGFTIHKHNKR